MRLWFNKTFSTIQAVFRNLHQNQAKQPVTIICTHTFPSASAFREADEAYLEPPELVGEAYLEWCLDFCQQQRIGLFWPGKEATLIAQHRADFQAIGTDVLVVAEANILNLFQHKDQFYALLPPDLAPCMAFRAVNTLNEFDQAIATLSLQHEHLCIKPAVSVFGLGFKILDVQRDSIVHVLKGIEYQIPLSELRQGMQNTPIFDTLLVMEHLGGLEWSVDCVGRYGELLCAVQRKKLPLAGRGQIIDHNADIQIMVENLTAHYRLHGIFNIQFKAGNTGIRLLEINARPSGGFGMSCLAVPELAQLALLAHLGKPLPPIAPRYGLNVIEVNTPVILENLA